jgi:uncharacterized protein (TIGR02466 family)
MNVKPDLVQSIFPIPLAYYKYPDDKHEELKVAVRKAIKRVQPGQNESSPDLVHFYQHTREHLLYDNDDPIFQHFHDWLEDCYRNMTEDVMGYKMTLDNMSKTNCYITDCWVNVTKTGGGQSMHYHVNSFISGTYYLQMPEGSGSIHFSNPAQSPNQPCLGFGKREITAFNPMEVSGKCEEQMLILWPSHIIHQTGLTRGDENRVSISMNFLPKEFVGGAYNFKIIKSDSEDTENYRTSTQLLDEN